MLCAIGTRVLCDQVDPPLGFVEWVNGRDFADERERRAFLRTARMAVGKTTAELHGAAEEMLRKAQEEKQDP